MENGEKTFEELVRETKEELSQAIDILTDSEFKRNKKFEEGRLKYLRSEYELARSKGGEEGEKRMRELNISIAAAEEAFKRFSKPISSSKDASRS